MQNGGCLLGTSRVCASMAYAHLLLRHNQGCEQYFFADSRPHLSDALHPFSTYPSSWSLARIPTPKRMRREYSYSANCKQKPSSTLGTGASHLRRICRTVLPYVPTASVGGGVTAYGLDLSNPFLVACSCKFYCRWAKHEAHLPIAYLTTEKRLVRPSTRNGGWAGRRAVGQQGRPL